MPVEGRLTLCNLSIDFSANSGFIAPDEAVFQYASGRPFAPKDALFERACAYWKTLKTDPGATFDQEVDIDVNGFAPYVTWGTSLDQVVALGGRVPDPATVQDPAGRALHARALEYMRLKPGQPIDGTPIDVAYIGSCTNSRLSDLRSAAAVLKGRKIATGVTAVCVPGSSAVKREAEAEGLDRIFKDAGFEWHESGCGMCCADGRTIFADRRVISTTNRNFEGRQGPQTRTHLASPATVAASAVAGKIADARKFVG
jgi:3-isopropylmalate/(R)-2-methylmalate dehydratase large subunit